MQLGFCYDAHFNKGYTELGERKPRQGENTGDSLWEKCGRCLELATDGSKASYCGGFKVKYKQAHASTHTMQLQWWVLKRRKEKKRNNNKLKM